MKANHHLKHCLFEYYAIFSTIIFLGTLLLFLVLRFDWKFLLAIEGGIVSFAFAVQKQQLEEVRLFKDLFKDFNGRYDGKNEALNAICGKPYDLELDDGEVKVLFDYFNLCGEEYLYYTRGFIYPEVWQAWVNGMKFFRKNPRIKKLWDDELQAGSYYGLSFEGPENCRSHEIKAN